VRFIGVDDVIEIWNRASADELLSDPEKVGDLLEDMMADKQE